MDFVSSLVGGQGCAADGTTTTRNPLSRLVDTLIEGSAGSQQKGLPRRAPVQGQTLRPQPAPRVDGETAPMPAAMPLAGQGPAGPHVGGMRTGPAGQVGLVGPPGRWMGPEPVLGPRGQGIPQGHQWASEFGQGPRPQLGHGHHGDFESAWEASQRPQGMPPPHAPHMAEAWANDFHGGLPRMGPARPPMMMPHPAEMEAAWAAARHDGAVPPPHVREFEEAFVASRTGAPPADYQGGPLPTEDPGAAALRRADGSTTASSTADGRSRSGPPEGGARHKPREGAGEGAEAGAEAERLRASANALAAGLASDPDGRFRDSDLLRFASEIGAGRLRVEGNKAVPGPSEELEAAWAGKNGQKTEGGEGALAPAEVSGSNWTEQFREAREEGEEEEVSLKIPTDGSFSEAWFGLDSGLDDLQGIPEAKTSASGDVLSSADQANLRDVMEAAWEEAKVAGSAAGETAIGEVGLEAAWADDEDGEPQSLEGVWRGTAARLEAGEEVGDLDSKEVPYELNAENRFSDLSDPFAQGVRLFEEGKIADAVLCFEAEINRNPENSEAWLMLGQSHAENDQDRLAIACLERAVEQDPYNLEGLLALGTSYVNELDSQRALHNLKAWVQHNPKYAGLEITNDEYSDGTLMDEVNQLMLQAQRWDPGDADVQVVLGVLYNVSRNYDSAAEAFRRALEARPHDHTLWNKLGATLANFSRSEEALPAYRQAISCKSGYARAWLNMGISKANLNQYDDAASCYFRALRLNPQAKHIWMYLRIVFSCMERFDLVSKASQENLEQFEGLFEDTG